MPVTRNAALAAVKSAILAVFYAIGLAGSTLFVLPILLVEQVFSNRSAHHGGRYGYRLPGRAGTIAMDVVAVLGTYVVADMLRCAVRMKTAWPEQIPGYGSSVGIHMKMIALLPIAWPLILYWLGWYADRWRSWRWRAWNTVAASVLLGLAMAAASLLIDRDRYPRFQIGLLVVLLPLATAVVRAVAQAIRWMFGKRQAGTEEADTGG